MELGEGGNSASVDEVWRHLCSGREGDNGSEGHCVSGTLLRHTLWALDCSELAVRSECAESRIVSTTGFIPQKAPGRGCVPWNMPDTMICFVPLCHV